VTKKEGRGEGAWNGGSSFGDRIRGTAVATSPEAL